MVGRIVSPPRRCRHGASRSPSSTPRSRRRASASTRSRGRSGRARTPAQRDRGAAPLLLRGARDAEVAPRTGQVGRRARSRGRGSPRRPAASRTSAARRRGSPRSRPAPRQALDQLVEQRHRLLEAHLLEQVLREVGERVERVGHELEHAPELRLGLGAGRRALSSARPRLLSSAGWSGASASARSKCAMAPSMSPASRSSSPDEEVRFRIVGRAVERRAASTRASARRRMGRNASPSSRSAAGSVALLDAARRRASRRPRRGDRRGSRRAPRSSGRRARDPGRRNPSAGGASLPWQCL